MSEQATPPRLPRDLVLRLVGAYQRNFQHLPMLHASDVLPLLHGDDREFAAASALLDAGRVFHPEVGPR